MSNMSAIQAETLRLLNKQKELLQSMKAVLGLLQKTDDKQLRNLTQEGINNRLQLLMEEQEKVERLETTIAVIGTMKAGKSTTINAIVGTEVLPNRDEPMTTLPTLISHVQGQVIPKLTFEKTRPFNEAIKQLKKALSKKRYSNASLDQLIQSIKKGTFKDVKPKYKGINEIYEFLKKLNDISRLCDELHVESPLTAYKKISELPRIEVEFSHLQDYETSGHLTLIDTPGPNEAGAEHLKGILKEQLQKASAVLVVMDSTQLKSEADAEVRAELMKQLPEKGERLYILANKRDLKSSKSMEDEPLKHYIAEQLFRKKIKRECIYPVSSKSAYLANRALYEIRKKGKINILEGWAKDFAVKAFGEEWEPEELKGIAKVEKKATSIWNKSGYQNLLNDVIVYASENAASMSVGAAVDNMLTYNKEIIDFIGFQVKAFHKTAAELTEHIEAFQKHTASLESIRHRILHEANNLLQQKEANLKDILQETQSELQENIERFFKMEKQGEVKSNKKQVTVSDNRLGKRMRDALQKMRANLPAIRTSSSVELEDMNTFSSEEEAKAFIDKIVKEIGEQTKKYSSEVQGIINVLTQELERLLKETMSKELRELLQQAAERMEEAFQLELIFPDISIQQLDYKFDDIVRDVVDATEEKRTGVRYVRKWYTLWLKEHEEYYTYHENVYKVDTKRLGKKFIEHLKKQGDQHQQKVSNHIKQEIDSKVNSYFTELSTYLQRYCGDLQDVVEAQSLKKEELTGLLASVGKIKKAAEEQQEDNQHVKDGLPIELIEKREVVLQ